MINIKIKNKILAIIFSLLFISFSCKVKHNTPLSKNPVGVELPNTIKVFVDQNGSFYPDNWQQKFGVPPKNGNKEPYSLKRIALKSNNQKEKLLKYLEASQNKKLEEIKQFLLPKQRVFIFVHGYNTSECEAYFSYIKIKESIDFDIDKDAFIEFYWDGLYSDTVVRAVQIWNNAAGYSQLAGEFGLRIVLNTISDKEIFIISHSRGASVVLSALSDPPYKPKFKEKTLKWHSVSIGNEPALSENNNKIICIMLAPAIGDIDFKKPAYYNKNYCYRKFSPQLKKIHITINPDDNTLKKYFYKFSGIFNPTDLGYNPGVYQKLSNNYTFLDTMNYSCLQSHNFSKYINDARFKILLNKTGINKPQKNNP